MISIKIFLPHLLALIMIILPFGLHAQDSISDREGNKYRIIQIGNQTWMADNLRTGTNGNGDSIEGFFYFHDSKYGPKYGKLYTWSAAMNGTGTEGSQGICPNGWHLPTDSEWTSLIDFFGGIDKAGSAMREKENPGFLSCFGGNYFPKVEIFSYIDQQAYFWSSTSYYNNTAWIRNFGYKTINANRTTIPKNYCFSVRCMKD